MSICSEHRQRGDILLEALVGVLIAALAAGGIAHLAGRVNDSQRQAKVEQLALEQMRNELHDDGVTLCGTTPSLTLPGNLTPTITVNCSAATTVTVKIGTCNYTVTPPTCNYTHNYTVTPPLEVSIAADAGSLGLSGSNALSLGTRQ